MTSSTSPSNTDTGSDGEKKGDKNCLNPIHSDEKTRPLKKQILRCGEV